MGFLSLYDEIERVKLGGEWWVDIKRYLTSNEADRAQRALVAPKMQTKVTDSGRQGQQRNQADAGDVREVTTTIDQGAYHHELLVAAIVTWNLTDQNDTLLPLTPEMSRRASVKALPGFARDKIVAAVLANRARTDEEQDAFREDGESVDPVPVDDPTAA